MHTLPVFHFISNSGHALTPRAPVTFGINSKKVKISKDRSKLKNKAATQS
jgi:hypothetical protein